MPRPVYDIPQMAPDQVDAIQSLMTEVEQPKKRNTLESVFDGAAPVSEDMESKLNALHKRIQESKNRKMAAASGVKVDVENMKAVMPKITGTLAKDHKIGRNEPCPCGSGKKYKNCCMNSGKYEGVHEI